MNDNPDSHVDISDILIMLEDSTLHISDIKKMYFLHKDNKQIVGHVAMNLSLRTSVYDRDKEYSQDMVEILSDIATNPIDMSARWAVAKNPHTPIDVLNILAKDDINLVRALVATNPATPPAILEKFFSDEKIVRDGLSGNPSTPLKLLKIFCNDSDKMVRLRLAENPKSPPEVLQILEKDLDPNVSKAAQLKLHKILS